MGSEWAANGHRFCCVRHPPASSVLSNPKRDTESFAHFAARVKQVERHLNSADFTAEGGRGLEGLARDLPRRCEHVVRLKGERLPK